MRGDNGKHIVFILHPICVAADNVLLSKYCLSDVHFIDNLQQGWYHGRVTW